MSVPTANTYYGCRPEGRLGASLVASGHWHANGAAPLRGGLGCGDGLGCDEPVGLWIVTWAVVGKELHGLEAMKQ